MILLILLICWVNDIEFGGAKKAPEVKEVFCLFVCFFFFLNFLGVGFSVDLVVSEIEIECFCLRQKIKAGRDGNTCGLS